MKYNVGDKVRIKSLDWYNENKSKSHGTVVCCGKYFEFGMKEWCGEIMTILEVDKTCYIMKEDGGRYLWTDEMIEGCVESIEDRLKELRKMCTISLTDGNYTDKVEVLLNDYEYIEENGKAFFVKKKKYPKTYEECCEIMDCAVHPYITANEPGIVSYYEDDLNRGVLSLRKLLICRDAYWKIAGEEMGLGKPWKPDWAMYSGLKHCIIYSDNQIKWQGKHFVTEAKVLAFPTKEMRDAFYENFKELIESVKEFL